MKIIIKSLLCIIAGYLYAETLFSNLMAAIVVIIVVITLAIIDLYAVKKHDAQRLGSYVAGIEDMSHIQFIVSEEKLDVDGAATLIQEYVTAYEDEIKEERR